MSGRSVVSSQQRTDTCPAARGQTRWQRAVIEDGDSGGCLSQRGPRTHASLMGIIAPEEDGEGFARLEQQRCPHRVDQLVIRAKAHIAVMLGMLAGDADGHGLRERDIECRIGIDMAVTAGRHTNCTAKIEFRLGGNEVDGAARGVAPVQRALGALEHFHPVEIVEEAPECGWRGEIDAIDIHRDRGVGKGVSTQIADRAHGEGGVGAAAWLNLDAGRLTTQRIDVVDPLGRKGIAADGDDRERGLLEIFRATLRRDDDVAKAAILAGRLTGRAAILSYRRGCQKCGKRCNRNALNQLVHAIPPQCALC